MKHTHTHTHKRTGHLLSGLEGTNCLNQPKTCQQKDVDGEKKKTILFHIRGNFPFPFLYQEKIFLRATAGSNEMSLDLGVRPLETYSVSHRRR